MSIAMKVLAKRARSRAEDWRRRLVRVRERSAASNVYHCCVHKTASQWIRRILLDARTYRHSGLRPLNYQLGLPEGYDDRRLTERTFSEPFPEGTAVTPIYVDYPGYRTIPKPASYRTFFVMRDPRDVMLSWYFSARGSHGMMGDIARNRAELQKRSKEDGLLYMVDYLSGYGLFEALRSWADAGSHDSRVRLVKYEDLIAPDGASAFRELFGHLDYRMPEQTLTELLDDHSFRRLSGRPAGKEDNRSHYRKGIAGDWRNHFTERVEARFAEASGSLLECLGYAASPAAGRYLRTEKTTSE